jgi:hypothetical protein
MRHLLITASAAALAIALWAGLGEAEAAPLSVGGLTGSGVPVLDVGYNRRHRSTTPPHGCANRDEIRELQREYPETRWPPSMRCVPYH